MGQVHVFCALWHPYTVLRNVATLEPIDVSAVFAFMKPVAQIDGATNIAELRALLGLDSSPKSVRQEGLLRFAGTPVDAPPPPENAAPPECEECKTNCGVAVSCQHEDCALKV